MNLDGGEFYTHLLVAESKSYRPTVEAVAGFVERLIENGNIGSGYELALFNINRVEPRSREIRNPFTGKLTIVRTPSQNRVKPDKPITAPSGIVALAGPEYDVVLSSNQVPDNPPFVVGSYTIDGWMPFLGPYFLSVRCKVRNALVRVSSFKSGKSTGANDDAITEPGYDEYCGIEECDGLFSHPEVRGKMTIANAGCAQFWVEFEYGKWIWPKQDGDRLRSLNATVLASARELFAMNFVEACKWT